MRTLTYTYDGLQRLIGAVESPGSSYAYQYDLAGNRTQVAANGATTQQHTYDAANQVQGWTYDAAGNLTGDGTSTNSYDALGRLTAGTSGAQGSTYSYNGDGTLVGQATGGVTTGYAQDVAGGQSQVLAIATGSGAGAGTVDQLWGLDRLASLNPTTGARAWYGYDGQGSARQLLNDAGHVTASASYDPYGTPEGAALPSPFGYTGELTDPATGSQYLRARWYRPGQGTLLGVDPALDSTGQPYSYADNNPANGSDPSGRCTVHLAGTEYSYLGAEGAGPCSAGLARRIGTVFRQGEGIPCLAAIGDQRYLVLTPQQYLAPLFGPGLTPAAGLVRAVSGSEPVAIPAVGPAGVVLLIGAGVVLAFKLVILSTGTSPQPAVQPISAPTPTPTLGPEIGVAPQPGTPPATPTPDPSERCGQIPGTLIIGGYCVGSHYLLTRVVLDPLDKIDPDGVPRQAHHIIQDAAVNGHLTDYSYSAAPAILLRGGTAGTRIPSSNPEHYLATLPQRNPCSFGFTRTWGTYGLEREIARAGLRNAHIPDGTSMEVVLFADLYFKGVLHATSQSPTGRPADRPSSC